MAIFKTGYDVGAVEELYKTDEFGGSDADLDNTVPVSDVDGYTTDIDLTDEEIAALAFEFLGNNSNDDLILTLFKRIGAAWTGNEILLLSFTVTNAGSRDVFTDWEIGEHRGFGPGIYRVGMQSEDTNTTFDMHATMTRTKRKTVEQ